MCNWLSLYNVRGGRRRARSPAIIDTASNHGDSLLRPVRKWMEEKSQKAPTVNLSAVGRPLHNIYMISTSLFILIVGIISVFLPSYIFIKGFPPRVNYRNFSSIVDTVVHLGTPGMLIGSFRCWSNRLSHKDFQQSNFCQVDHSSY